MQRNGTAGCSSVASRPAAVDRRTRRRRDQDDWEPAIATANGPYVYMLVTRIGDPSRGNCPSAYLALELDRRVRHGARRPLCAYEDRGSTK